MKKQAKILVGPPWPLQITSRSTTTPISPIKPKISSSFTMQGKTKTGKRTLKFSGTLSRTCPAVAR